MSEKKKKEIECEKERQQTSWQPDAFLTQALFLFGEHLWHLGLGGFGVRLAGSLSQVFIDNSELATSASHLLHESV